VEVWAVELDAGRRERWLEKRLRRTEEVEALVKRGGAVELLGAGGTIVFVDEEQVLSNCASRT